MTTQEQISARVLLLEQFQEGKSENEALDHVHHRLGSQSMSKRSATIWFNKFKRGQIKVCRNQTTAGDRALMKGLRFLGAKRWPKSKIPPSEEYDVFTNVLFGLFFYIVMIFVLYFAGAIDKAMSRENNTPERPNQFKRLINYLKARRAKLLSAENNMNEAQQNVTVESKVNPKTKNENSVRPRTLQKKPIRRRNAERDISAVPQKPKERSTAQQKPIKPTASKEQQSKTQRSIRRTSVEKTQKETTASFAAPIQKTIRRRSKDKFTKMRVVMSRPLRERGMQKMLERVKNREQASEGNAHLKEGDDQFPRLKTHARKLTDGSPKNSKASPKTADENTTQKSAYEENSKHEKVSILNADGRPFWQQKNKGEQQALMDEEDITDDSLPMNASIIVEITAGNIKLTEMPKTNNTVRSMVNLADDGETKSEYQVTETQDEPNRKPLTITEPETIVYYDSDGTYYTLPISPAKKK
ncbi:hypothetical protein M3Y98_00960400 [Aphelenchoides besseyi]|nr:hypothetical protein M3Y98_00960400 [Aphelenchoides besseyi]